MPVVSVSMPSALIERLDAVADDHDYAGRSAIVRESTRALLDEFENDRLEGRDLAGVVSVGYGFGTRSVERRLADLRHEHDGCIVATDHCHVADSCIDLFVLEGTVEVVSAFVGRVRAIEAVRRVDSVLVPLDATDQVRGT